MKTLPLSQSQAQQVRDFCIAHPSEGINGAVVRVGADYYILDADDYDAFGDVLGGFIREVEAKP